MDKVKLLFLVDQLGGGGAERVVTESAIHLPSNFETLVCLTRRDGNFEYTEMLKDHDVPFISLERKWRFDLAGLSKLYRLVQDFKPDIMHTHKFGSNVLGRLLRVITPVPVLVCHEHTWNYDSNAVIRIWINRILAPLSDAIIAVSEEDRKKLIGIEKLPPGKVITIYNGIDFSRLESGVQSKEFRSILGLSEDDFIIAIIGKLHYQKGHKILLNAFKTVVDTLDNVHLLVVGEGALENTIKEQALGLGLQNKVSFLGFRTDIGSILRLVDLLVMPSLFEGHPITLLEAMAAGKMVIASNVGGIPEVIKHNETGYLVPPSSPQALSSAILEVACDKSLRDRIGKAASIEVRERFSIQTSVKKYVELYENLLRTKQ